MGPIVSHVLLDQPQVSGRQCKCAIIIYSHGSIFRTLFGVIPLKDRVKHSSLSELENEVITNARKDGEGAALNDQESSEGASPKFGITIEELENKINAKAKLNNVLKEKLKIVPEMIDFSFRNPSREIALVETIESTKSIQLQPSNSNKNSPTALLSEENYLKSFYFGDNIDCLEIKQQIAIDSLLAFVYEEWVHFPKKKKEGDIDLSSLLGKYKDKGLSSEAEARDQSYYRNLEEHRHIINTNLLTENIGSPSIRPIEKGRLDESVSSHKMETSRKVNNSIRRRYQKIDLIKKVCNLLDAMDENSQKIDIQIDLIQKMRHSKQSSPTTKPSATVVHNMSNFQQYYQASTLSSLAAQPQHSPVVSLRSVVSNQYAYPVQGSYQPATRSLQNNWAQQ